MHMKLNSFHQQSCPVNLLNNCRWIYLLWWCKNLGTSKIGSFIILTGVNIILKLNVKLKCGTIWITLTKKQNRHDCHLNEKSLIPLASWGGSDFTISLKIYCDIFHLHLNIYIVLCMCIILVCYVYLHSYIHAYISMCIFLLYSSGTSFMSTIFLVFFMFLSLFSFRTFCGIHLIYCKSTIAPTINTQCL